MMKDNEKDPKSQPDSFSKPRTIPSNWDVSAFSLQVNSSHDHGFEEPLESELPEESAAADETAQDWSPEPFPKPRTIPGNWDTSNLK